MNVSKFITKLVFLAFFVLSGVQGSIFAGTGENESPPFLAKEDKQSLYKSLEKRSKWKNMFGAAGFLAFSACFFCCGYDSNDIFKKIAMGFYGSFCGVAGAGMMYDFLKARVWGR